MIGSVLYYGGGALALLAMFLTWTAGPSGLEVVFGALGLCFIGVVCSWIGYYLRGRGH